MLFTRVISLIQVLVNQFLRYFLILVIKLTLFLAIQFLVNYKIQTPRCHMDRVAKKYKRRGEDMKSSDASSDEMTADANILLHVLVKLRGKEKHPDGFSNFNHLANEDIICSFEDNLKFSSKNVVEFNGMQEVLPVRSPSDPVTNLPHCFITPSHHSSKNLLLHTMNP